jgi:hypothetical protein
MTVAQTDPSEIFLARLYDDLRVASGRRQRQQRRLLIAVVVCVGAVLLAAGAFAAVRAFWSGRDLSSADIARQATTVSNDSWLQCDAAGSCVRETGTHPQIHILPAMGVTFVLPDGHTANIVPAEPMLPGLPNVADGTLKPTTDASGNWTGGTWTIDLPSGGQRTVVWHQADGSIVAVDREAGKTTTTVLHAGDVVTLIPGSISPQSRTLEKAVTFDLPSGERVIIFPIFNETYVGAVNQPGDPPAEPLTAGAAAKYGLSPVGEYNGTLPVTATGGTWTIQLPQGGTRTISWTAGSDQVAIHDTTASGSQQTTVPIGHELPLVPCR